MLTHSNLGCRKAASVRALSPIVWRPFQGGSEGAPVSLCGGGPPSPTGRVGHSGAAGAPT
eukprot:4114181-Alexandrium_andersonii.AAC.1